MIKDSKLFRFVIRLLAVFLVLFIDVGVFFAMPKSVAVKSFVDKLPLKDKVSQLFIVNLEGNSTFQSIEDFTPGGYLLFSYNIADTQDKVMTFTKSIKDYYIENKKIAPYLAIDQEGGFVNRLKGIAGPLPSAKRVKECLTKEGAYTLYTLQARQLKLLGFDMNLSPVVEVCTKENEKFLNGRSYGTLEDVVMYARGCIKASLEQGIAPIIKHFPGNTNADPHTNVSMIELTEGKTIEEYLESFEKTLSSYPTGVLLSHAILKEVSGESACLSKEWVTGYLRQRYRYNGLIFSDDIYMKALSANNETVLDNAIKALQAGVTCIMSSEKRIGGLVEGLCKKANEDKEFLKVINNAVAKVIEYKVQFNLMTVTMADEVENAVFDYGDKTKRLKEYNKVLWDNIYLYRKYFQ